MAPLNRFNKIEVAELPHTEPLILLQLSFRDLLLTWTWCFPGE